jgi:hypothetical protein
MSGAIMTNMGGSAARSFPDGFVPRATFGTRASAEARQFAMMARSVDSSVPALRRRIATTPAKAQRLPWAVGGAVIVGLSAALWLNLFEVSSALAHDLALLF